MRAKATGETNPVVHLEQEPVPPTLPTRVFLSFPTAADYNTEQVFRMGGPMFLRMLLPLILLTSSVAIANNKQKTVLPASVLKARNVVVLIDPDAGISVTDPLANTKAQEQVE